MRKSYKYWLSILGLCIVLVAFSQEPDKKLVYILNIKQEITKAVWRHTQQAFAAADSLKADAILIHMNTYGGTVVDADSIRTKILASKIPVYVFIDNNAASAGALIAIACDSIYMRPGGSIGAATVVNQTGAAMPDKYQSYMRSTMRSTAEAHGKDTIITATDTIIKWHRDPLIAEAMVDQRIYIKGIVDTGKVLTFTPSEAIANGFSEGTVENIGEVLGKVGIKNYEIVEYEPSWIEKIIGFLVHPMISGLLIMAIIGGIYFELQTPGIGFPLGLAILAATLYFAPLYLEGLAENWEILIFIVGLILIAVEVFVIPGFGVTGALGLILAFGGLTLSLIDNIKFDFEGVDTSRINTALTTVVVAVAGGFFASLYLSKKLFSAETGPFRNLSLKSVQNVDEGYVSIEIGMLKLKGKSGTAKTVLRPGGKVLLDGEVYDAVAESGYIDQGEAVTVTRVETTQVYVERVE
ncbi:MAG: nodulation protein NfeD [Chlorobi bacterium]|nr:nodulation protein NfeD [Chlorobiota bacterium]